MDKELLKEKVKRAIEILKELEKEELITITKKEDNNAITDK